MIPFIRSLSELMAITKSRDYKKDFSINNEIDGSIFDGGQRKRYIRSIKKGEVNLPDLPQTIRRKWMQNRDYVSRLINDLDYNNQIQSSYNLTLLESQNKSNHQDIA